MIFQLGNTTKSRCLGVRVKAQAHGKEPWINKRPTSDRRCSDWQRTLSDDRRLRTHSDWVRKLSPRALIGYENYQKIRSTRTGIEKSYGRTYLHR